VPGVVPSLATKSRASAAEVFVVALSNAPVVLAVGSSTSFSRCNKGYLLTNVVGGMEGGISPRRIFIRLLPPAFVKAATGFVLLDAIALLSDAWAVFADTDAVGGPETKIERRGGSNEVGEVAISP